MFTFIVLTLLIISILAHFCIYVGCNRVGYKISYVFKVGLQLVKGFVKRRGST